MHQHSMTKAHGASSLAGESVILVGNPNVGKSVIFSYLTGHYAEVSNYPGTTVEVMRGQMRANGARLPVIDTPGINSLLSQSMDEQVTRDILLTEAPRAVVQVADAKNLRRALLLTGQLAELGLPLVLVLNMQDEAQSRGIQIDTAELQRRLGIEVLATVAIRGEGLHEIPDAIKRARPSSLRVRYDETIETRIQTMEDLLPPETSAARGLAVMALAGDGSPSSLPEGLHPQVDQIRREAAARYDGPVIYAINQQRLRAVDGIIKGVYTRQGDGDHLWSERLGQLAIHPVWGWLILLLVLYGIYQFVGVLGAGILVDYFETTVFGEWINPLATRLAGNLLPLPILRDFLVGEYGMVTMALSYGVAIVLPIVTTFFLAFSLLEDSGYLARLAVIANRPFKAMGLNGKAVLPMVLGLGCDTMATMSTRILETRKERLQVTLLLALGVPCSAQLGVILAMVGAVSGTGLLVWGGVVIGVLLAVGRLASKIIPGETSDFIVELPPMRPPRLSSIAIKTIARLEWYLKEVLPLFVIGTAALFVLDRTGGLLLIERMASPLVEGLLGLPAEATSAFLIGFLRRDYGAAGLFDLSRQGLLTGTQVLVSLVVLTLFMPCIANLLMIVKEFGWRTAAAVSAFIVPFAFAVGGVMNATIRILGISF